MIPPDPKVLAKEWFDRIRAQEDAEMREPLYRFPEYGDEHTYLYVREYENLLRFGYHQAMQAELVRLLRRAGARVEMIPIRLMDYFVWLAKYDLRNDADNRNQYIHWVCFDPPRPEPVTNWGERLKTMLREHNRRN